MSIPSPITMRPATALSPAISFLRRWPKCCDPRGGSAFRRVGLAAFRFGWSAAPYMAALFAGGIASGSAFALGASKIAAASLPTPQQIARRAFGGAVLIVMEDSSGQPTSLGSGFFVGSGAIATNLHVVRGAARGWVRLVGQKNKLEIMGLVAIDSRRDLVILKVPEISFQALRLGDSDKVQVGEPVFAVGNPQGLEGTFSQGIVSSLRDFDGDKLLQITAPISPGSSGGPVLNEKGEVVGVSVATYKGGQNLNFAIPSNHLSRLIATIGPARPLAGAVGGDAGQSIVAGQGERSVAGVEGHSVEWEGSIYAGTFSFTLANKLRDDVRDVQCRVVFFGGDLILDSSDVFYRGIIPGGLARRVDGKVHPSVPRRTTKVEVHVLDFRLQ